MFVDPDFIFTPNKKCIYIDEFCFKFTLDVIKCITKFNMDIRISIIYEYMYCMIVLTEMN